MSREVQLKIISWNILAHDFTHYNSIHHLNGMKMIESQTQTRLRYEWAHDQLMSEDADVVLLQEVSPLFFQQRQSEALLDIYSCYTTYGFGDSPGTAVLVKDKACMYGRVQANTSTLLSRVDGCIETGGWSKSATIVDFLLCDGTKAIVISTHTTFDGNSIQRHYHMDTLGRLLESLALNSSDIFVIGGDFNCRKGSQSFAKLRRETFLGRLELVDLGPCAPTVGSGETIDHIFIGRNPRIRILHTMTEKQPGVTDPYEPTHKLQGCAKIIGASDHVWIAAIIEIHTGDAPSSCDRERDILGSSTLPPPPAQNPASEIFGKWDTVVALKIEATCQKEKPLWQQEIIEFSLVAVDSASRTALCEFHDYVRPVASPRLSDFCTELTGIQQATVDGSDVFPTVLARALQWLLSLQASRPGESMAVVTCGDWDLKTMLPSQCRYSGVAVPEQFVSWVNIKKEYARVVGREGRGMAEMLAGLGLTLDGHHHSGIDDCRNIAKVVVSLLEKKGSQLGLTAVGGSNVAGSGDTRAGAGAVRMSGIGREAVAVAVAVAGGGGGRSYSSVLEGSLMAGIDDNRNRQGDGGGVVGDGAGEAVGGRHGRTVHSCRSQATSVVREPPLAPRHEGKSIQFDVYLVLDFEATCDKDRRLSQQEIIEFPIVAVDVATRRILCEFHEYVRPVASPRLSDFCTELTGIQQATVDGSDVFPTVLARAVQWLLSLQASRPGESMAVVTCGDWDLKTMLPSQCRYSGVAVPEQFVSWVNIKKEYARVVGREGRGMAEMLAGLGLTLDGHHHSGIDDCRNIAKVVVSLLEKKGSQLGLTTVGGSNVAGSGDTRASGAVAGGGGGRGGFIKGRENRAHAQTSVYGKQGGQI